MISGQNNRTKSNSSRKRIENILKFYLFTVVLVGLATGFIFTFKISYLLISTLIISIIFIVYFYFNSSVKDEYYNDNSYDNEVIKFNQPRNYKDESKLVELERKNLNFIISDFEEEASKFDMNDEVRSTYNGNSDEDSSSVENLKELKKRYNPYKSPFEPINPPVIQAESINKSSIHENEPVADIENSVIVEKLDQHEGAGLTFSKEVFEIGSDNNNQLNSRFEETINKSEYENSNYSSNEEQEFDDDDSYENDALNVIQFRPRVVGNSQDDTAITKDSRPNTIVLDESYKCPPYELLRHENYTVENELQLEEQEIISNKLVDTLASFGVGAKVVDVSVGPSVTRYELQPNPGVKVSKIVGLSDDIALNLAATGVRIEAPIPGKAAVGIEVPNKEITPVLFGDVIRSTEFNQHRSKLAFALGKDVAGRTIVGDVAKMPHLLIAGATGSGKSVCINTLIASILFKASPSEVKLLLVDPKVVELGIYNGIPHLLIPVVTDPKKAAGALNWAVIEMTNRYKLFAENNVRDLKGYNSQMKAKNEPTLPQIVIIIDELADLMMVAANDVEDCICRLAQMARAAGMHLVIATQRPSVDVITGVIKANIPSRISFAVSSQIDSRTILDMAGAEKLLGRGDMLFYPIGEMKPTRVQGSFITDGEIEEIVSFLKENHTAAYDQDILDKINAKEQQASQNEMSDDDELLPQVAEMVIEYGQASASLIQRKFKVGYSRAARILDQMESWGVVGPADGSKPRQILITKQEWDEINS